MQKRHPLWMPKKITWLYVLLSYHHHGRKHRRNLNILVCGGSGAGKTRFFAKPNVMNANTSFVCLAIAKDKNEDSF